MFCLRKDKSSVSSNVIACSSAAAIFQKENLQGSRDHPMGGGMLGKLSKIVILCYYVSIFYLINYYKTIQNIKNCRVLPTPPTGGGVWCDTPAVNLEPPLTRWHDWKEVNKYGGSHPRGQSLLRYEVRIQSRVCHVWNKTKEIDDSVLVTFDVDTNSANMTDPTLYTLPRTNQCVCDITTRS